MRKLFFLCALCAVSNLFAWDYEHIVLERFSEVAYVKCLPAHSIKNLSDPGTMTLIVVPEYESLARTLSNKYWQ